MVEFLKKSVGFTRIGPHIRRTVAETGQDAQTHSTKYRKFFPWQKIYSPFKKFPPDQSFFEV